MIKLSSWCHVIEYLVMEFAKTVFVHPEIQTHVALLAWSKTCTFFSNPEIQVNELANHMEHSRKVSQPWLFFLL